MRGVVKFFKEDKGWGALVTPELQSDVFLHFSAIEGHGYRMLHGGDVVGFDVEEAQQDRFRYRAVRAAFVEHGEAPTLRRRGDDVVIAPAGTPDTPLTPRRPATGNAEPERA